MKNIRNFNDFEGQDGYLIVDGITEEVSGGKKKLSEIIPEIPTKVSDLTNDSNFITLNDVPAQVQADWNQTTMTAKDYIKNKPTIVEEVSIYQGHHGYIDVPISAGKIFLDFGTGALDVNESGIIDFSCDYPLYNDDGAAVLLYDDDTLTLDDNHGYLAVKHPVPDPSDENKPAQDGYVLTYDADSDSIVWAAPAGGGGALPEYTLADVNKVLYVKPLTDYINYETVVTGAELDWTPGLPTELNDRGSGASYYGGVAGVKARFPGQGEPPIFELGGFLNYDYKSYPEISDQNYWDGTSTQTWSTCINNNEYKHMASITDYDEITPTRLNIIVRRANIQPPNVLLEFANALDTAIDFYVGFSVDGTDWCDENISMPLKPIGEAYTDEHKIPANSFVSIQIIGHGYFIRYRPLTSDEIDDPDYKINIGNNAMYPDMPTHFY